MVQRQQLFFLLSALSETSGSLKLKMPELKSKRSASLGIQKRQSDLRRLGPKVVDPQWAPTAWYPTPVLEIVLVE